MSQILDFYGQVFANCFSWITDLGTTYSVPFAILVGLFSIMFVVFIGVFAFKRFMR